MAATELGGPCPDSLKSRMRLKSITACSNPGQSDPPHRAMLSRSLCPPRPITLQRCPSTAPHGLSDPAPGSPSGRTGALKHISAPPGPN